MKTFRNLCDNKENHENPRNQYENQENRENHRNQFENNENHENPRNQCEKYENQRMFLIFAIKFLLNFHPEFI